MEEHMKKILSFVVVVMMLVSCLSLSVFAADNYAWQFNNSSGSYLYINGYGDSPCIIEFDVRFDNGGDPYRINCWTGNGIEIQPSYGTIGVSNTTLTRQFSAGTWYHVKFDGASGSGTSIEVDGTFIGNVGNTIQSMQCLGMVMVTIDNFVMTVNGNAVIDEDFQDKNFDGVNGDTNGAWVIANDLNPDPGPGPQPHTHTWDNGVIQGNKKVFTCTTCGETYEVDYNPNDLGWWCRINGYGHICKEVDRCDGPAVQNKGYVDFDLIMLPGENGHCQIRFFDSYEGSTRTYLEDYRVGYHYTYEEAEGFSSFNWGDMSVNNIRHIRYAYTDEEVKLYVDGSLVYTNDYGCTPAMHGLVFYVESGSALVDNMVFTDTKGNTMFSRDFESGLGDFDQQETGGVTRVHLGDCANGNHVALNNSRVGLAPTCTEDGYVWWPCAVCGLEAKREVTEKLGHNFGTYAQGATAVAATGTTDGVKTWTCLRCSAATATGVIPATNDYTGTILYFDDASDENVTKFLLGGFNIEAGVDEHDGLSYPGDVNMEEDGVTFVREYTTANYHEFPNVSTSGYTVAFDFRLNDVFDTNDTEGYGHRIYFWVGGENNVANNIGYDFDTGEFFIEPSTGEAYDALAEDATIEEGVWHNIMFKYYSNATTYSAYAALYLDGVEIVRFEGGDAPYELPYAAGTQNFPLLFRSFGVAGDYTNWVIGSVDFNWVNSRTPESAAPCQHVWDAGVVTVAPTTTTPGVRTYTCTLCGATRTEAIDPVPPVPVKIGDANGDGSVDARDLRLVKQYVVGDVDDDGINLVNADLNNDGNVDGRDAALLRTYIVNN